jgi:tetratricopeptide (TPR) repeat protein
MFTGGYKDQKVVERYQEEQRRQAEQYRAAQAARDTDDTSGQFPLRGRIWVVIGLVIVLAVVFLFAGYMRVYAQDMADPGQSEPFPGAMLAYRLGSYYLVTGDYDRAVAKLGEAVELMPEWAFAVEPDYADLFWTLGEAQEHLGLVEDALANYRQFLALVGDDAAPWTIEWVQQLELRLAEAPATAFPT